MLTPSPDMAPPLYLTAQWGIAFSIIALMGLQFFPVDWRKIVAAMIITAAGLFAVFTQQNDLRAVADTITQERLLLKKIETRLFKREEDLDLAKAHLASASVPVVARDDARRGLLHAMRAFDAPAFDAYVDAVLNELGDGASPEAAHGAGAPALAQAIGAAAQAADGPFLAALAGDYASLFAGAEDWDVAACLGVLTGGADIFHADDRPENGGRADDAQRFAQLTTTLFENAAANAGAAPASGAPTDRGAAAAAQFARDVWGAARFDAIAQGDGDAAAPCGALADLYEKTAEAAPETRARLMRVYADPGFAAAAP